MKRKKGKSLKGVRAEEGTPEPSVRRVSLVINSVRGTEEK